MKTQGKIIGGFGVGLEECAPLDDPKSIAATDAAEGRSETRILEDFRASQIIALQNDYPAPATPPIEHIDAFEHQNREQTGTLHGADCTM
jgi:hypothetical protein